MAEYAQNQHHQLVEKGLNVFGPSPTQEEPFMPITGEQFRKHNSGGPLYTAQNDIFETKPDGRVIKGLAAGDSIPMDEAVKRGYVKVEPEKKVGPSEAKPAPTRKETK
jgi:hypothetical protein